MAKIPYKAVLVVGVVGSIFVLMGMAASSAIDSATMKLVWETAHPPLHTIEVWEDESVLGIESLKQFHWKVLDLDGTMPVRGLGVR